MAKSLQLYTLHVQLQYIRPAIWRRIEVEGTESLRKLHHILQAAFGWSDAHRHDFLIDDDTYAQLDIDAGLEFMDLDRTLDDRKAKVHKVLRPGARMLYRYDFGDGWDHDIVVEKIETIDREPWGVAQVDLPPINRATGNLVKSVFREEDGHEEALYGRADYWFPEGGRGGSAGQGTVQKVWFQ
ncbi:plasmid pRiA4b ORF-3 family protein [Pandoraea pnomenusa]|uniref:plasmid pRiA4b ORF-3 family protein n=1 Tax=Pandoraea pnomenusa TaxID=93220 RepID=UPI000437581F|nr:plasmid pRiA4b ORF-3 family protein [Pandoraea pnomenusa]